MIDLLILLPVCLFCLPSGLCAGMNAMQKKSERKSKKDREDADEKEKDVDQKDDKETKSSDEKTKEDSPGVTEVCILRTCMHTYVSL